MHVWHLYTIAIDQYIVTQQMAIIYYHHDCQICKIIFYFWEFITIIIAFTLVTHI